MYFKFAKTCVPNLLFIAKVSCFSNFCVSGSGLPCNLVSSSASWHWRHLPLPCLCVSSPTQHQLAVCAEGLPCHLRRVPGCVGNSVDRRRLVESGTAIPEQMEVPSWLRSLRRQAHRHSEAALSLWSVIRLASSVPCPCYLPCPCHSHVLSLFRLVIVAFCFVQHIVIWCHFLHSLEVFVVHVIFPLRFFCQIQYLSYFVLAFPNWFFKILICMFPSYRHQ